MTSDFCLANPPARAGRASSNVLCYIHAGKRGGLTLIEILVALTMTLIVLGAMMTAFQFASEKMQIGRAMMELANRTRTVESLLRSDLSNLTLDPRPYAQTSAPNGFFEYIEGAINDNTLPTANPNLYAYLGDIDDAMGMTVRSPARPFRGRNVPGAANPLLESSLAEIWWYTTWTDNRGSVNAATTAELDESIRIHRRVLLIRPDLGVINPTPLVAADVNTFLSQVDISCRTVVVTGGANPTYNVVANNLADLAHRRNRFAHIFGTFPHSWSPGLYLPRGDSSAGDILLTDAAAFDIRVFSPDANVNTAVNTGVDIIAEPGDPGYVNTTANANNDLGAFVDLAYDLNATAGPYTDDAWFSGAAQTNGYSFVAATYDTWTPFYESDGIDQDGDGNVDQGTDGLDTDNANGVDDTAERETLPPYPYPIRGLKVSIRAIEKGTKQVQQTSIIQSFVPE